MKRIVVLEDECDLAYGLANNLEIEGYEVEVFEDGKKGLEGLLSSPPDLLVLDLMLPGVDGYRILKTVRDAGHPYPVLILSARGEEVDKVRGFRLGADDYVTKPFGVMELLARIDALLRRAVGPAKPEQLEPLSFGDVSIDPKTRIVERAGQEVLLAPKEYDLLLALLLRRGEVISRFDLLREVWGHAGRVLTRTVDTHVAQLRRKLERDPAGPIIFSPCARWGTGCDPEGGEGSALASAP